MSENGSPGTPGSRSRSNKSVRWTGRDDHRHHEVHDNDPHNHEDYFSFSGGSANQSLNAIDDSDSGASSDDHEDETLQHMRATTRANTWFNRLRQDESDGDADADDDHNDSQNDHLMSSTAGPSRPAGPSQPGQISASDYPGLNPYAHLMDLGTHVSGSLAPGGAEQIPDDDPINEEYLDRHNKLMQSIGQDPHHYHDQQQRDPSDPEAIPLQNIPSSSSSASLGSGEIQTGSFIGGLEPPKDSENMEPIQAPPRPVTPEIVVHEAEDEPPSSTNSVEKQQEQHTHDQAEILRHELDIKQRERNHRMDELISSRKARDEKRQIRRNNRDIANSREASPNPDSPNHDSSNPDLPKDSAESHKSHESDNASQKDDEDDAKEEEELKRLEEAAKQEAEDHAKQLVTSHLNTNLLNPNVNNDGYVENPGYALDAAILDDDLSVNDVDLHGDKKDDSKSTDKNDSKDSTDSTEKDHSKNSTNDSSDSDDDSDDDDDNQNKGDVLRGDPDYVPPPKKVKEGVLGSLLRLYAGQEEDDAKSVASVNSPAASDPNTPLHSPGGSISESPQDGSYSPLPEHPDEMPAYSSDDGMSSMNASSKGSSKLWKRPNYFRTNSAEDPLGRSKQSRPGKWYQRPSYQRTNSISELASTGFAAATSAAHDLKGQVPHPHPPSFSSGSKLSSKIKNKMTSAPSDPAAAEAKYERKNQEMAKHIKEKEARKQAKKAEQAERERKKALKRARIAEQQRITVHIADVLQRQRFLLRMGRALMLFGAPSHRLEEYLKTTARVLEIDAQVLYMPGCMLVSFGDATTHTSETKLLRVTQGLNLNKLHATHLIYKEVVHDLMSLEEASSHIDHLLRSKNLYPWWLVVFFYGIACVSCGLFAYNAWWSDTPLIFVLGGAVGFLQFWCQPKSDLYANIFEVSSSVVVSLIGRAFGSIKGRIGEKADYIFCFAAVTQASLALILPGYIILVGALELQTKNLVAGSVRMFYANIYSLFLSFGMTLGTSIFGWMYKHATTETSCKNVIDDKWKILFVPAATLFMAVVNQAGPRQLPIMVIIGSAGYAVQFFVQQHVGDAASFTSAIGAFTMGVIGNLYSRVGHGLAFAAMLPGIFVLVPSGIAAQDSFVAGLRSASQITNGNHSETQKQNQQTADSISELGNSMTQVAVGIVVGLFAATLVVYPLGMKKKRSGLFTF